MQNFKIKANWVRRQCLEMVLSAGKGHIGGALSCVDILVALYYGKALRKKDKFILSKGHACLGLYAILADLGFFPLSELSKFYQKGGILTGHPSRKIPGIEIDSGSLGHGLSIGAGLALSAKIDNRNSTIFVLMGDGECHEGSVWEAAMFAAHHKLSNLIGIIDNNQIGSIDFIKDCMELEPLIDKWRAFGWQTIPVNGHSFKELSTVLSSDIHNRDDKRPLMIIANTIKGKGISYMEGKTNWHHGVPKGKQIEIARKELDHD